MVALFLLSAFAGGGDVFGSGLLEDGPGDEGPHNEAGHGGHGGTGGSKSVLPDGRPARAAVTL
ncbi:hypothetical protein [Granulicella pectinivorans]|uniref:hypothetical protein n=1 Tax=Granulicella pectinivorans TaxID=474950 RepID=UPI00113FC910|nr:hypothetical protein [Granulicella pectinivorans]